MNCKKCGVDLRGLYQIPTKDGWYCEHCYHKYILQQEKQTIDSFVTHLRQIPDKIEIFSVNDLW